VIKGTYASSDACERADAFRFGYLSVCHHPKEIGVLGLEELLVIDFDHVLFGDKDLAVLKANEAASRGVPVGIHTYSPEDPRLTRLLALPNVFVAKTHRRVLVLMRRWAQIRDREQIGSSSRPETMSEEMIHVGEDPE